MVIAIPVLFIVVGALMYALSTNPKLAELGRLTFAAGVFGLAIGAASYVTLFSHSAR